ncbi:hypothetical protein [Nonomuraea polychroma]|nr:hypothetical protein [Nonomuraea polychroma]
MSYLFRPATAAPPAARAAALFLVLCVSLALVPGSALNPGTF